MKTAILTTVLALGLILSGAAFAETASPKKSAAPKVDTITTQSIVTIDDQKCGAGLVNSDELKNCGNSSPYPSNPMSGLNLN